MNLFSKKKFFFLIVLFTSFVFALLSYNNSSKAQYETCGDPGTCGILAGCDCYQKPVECGVCGGSQDCGDGTCPDGKRYDTICSPDCSSPTRTCYDTPTCSGSTGCTSDSECTTNDSSCGYVSNPGCARAVCNVSGGNCYTDCSSCILGTPTGGSCDSGCGTCGYRNSDGTCSSSESCCHNECAGEACVTVSGGGTDSCSAGSCGGGPAPTSPPGASPTPTPTGDITASPNPCSIPAGGTQCSSTINWSTSNTSSAIVCVDSGSGESLFANILSGSQNASWIGGNNVYTFRLRTGTTCGSGTILDTVDVSAIFSAQYMYYCSTDSYTCGQTANQYTSASECANNLATFLPGQTTGTCYTSSGSCSSSCSPSSQYMYVCRTDLGYSCTQTSGEYLYTSDCEDNLVAFGVPSTGVCYRNSSTCDENCLASPEYMYYCSTNYGYTCQQTSSQYLSVSECESNLQSFLPGQTTGTCYTSSGSCGSACVPPPQHMYYCSTGSYSCIQTSSQYSYTSDCEANLESFLPGQTTGYCFSDLNTCSNSCSAPVYTISGNVYVDANRNGSKDAGETNYQGATVTISVGASGTRTTNSTGNYSFTSLTGGWNYTLSLTVPGGYVATTTNPVNVTNLSSNTTVNFGIAEAQYTISGNVYVDANKNRVKDAGEVNYNGATVNLSGGASRSTTTNSSGNYSFANLNSSNYTVTLQLPAGYSATTANPITVQNLSSNATVNFGIAQAYTISGNVYVDANRNGSKDAGESNYNGAGIGLSGTATQSTSTNSSGNYSFANLNSGNYTVTLTVPAGYQATTTNPVSLNLTGNTTVNFGIVQQFTISGNVFDDFPVYGLREAGEPGHPGIRVTLSGPASGTDDTDINGDYSFTNLLGGVYTLTITVPAGYEATTTNPVSTGSISSNTIINFGITPIYTISSDQVYYDYNHNGAVDPEDTPAANIEIVLSGGESQTTTTNALGEYTFEDLRYDDYIVTMTVPPGYEASTTNPVSVIGLSTNTTVNFGLAPLYSISGAVFMDTNKNERKDAGESNYTLSSQTFTLTNITTGAQTNQNTINGSYSFQSLTSGNYRVSYSSLPENWTMIYPQNGPPPFFNITVGNPCSTDSGHDSSCTAGYNIINLNFAINNSNPWFQCIGADCRKDEGFSNSIPGTASLSCGGAYASIPQGSSTPGIVFSGDGSYGFGEGQASENPYNWVAGGTEYPEIFQSVRSGVIRTSYDYYTAVAKQSGITPTELGITECGVGGLASCDLATTSLVNGIYKSSGDLTLVGRGSPPSYTFPANRNYVFLIDGDLRLDTYLHVPNGSTATFSVSGSIYVDQSIGESMICSETTDIEGFFSADDDFIIEGNGSDGCVSGDKDERLNIGGSVVVNADLEGGDLISQRDLCEDNAQAPAYSIIERADMLLNAPDFIKHPNFIWQEVVP